MAKIHLKGPSEEVRELISLFRFVDDILNPFSLKLYQFGYSWEVIATWDTQTVESKVIYVYPHDHKTLSLNFLLWGKFQMNFFYSLECKYFLVFTLSRVRFLKAPGKILPPLESRRKSGVTTVARKLCRRGRKPLQLPSQRPPKISSLSRSANIFSRRLSLFYSLCVASLHPFSGSFFIFISVLRASR